LAKDKVYPGIHYFAAGYGVNNEPIRGYVLCALGGIAFTLIGNKHNKKIRKSKRLTMHLICFIGDLNAVGTLVANSFLASYTLVNFSVFHASISNSPGWRPGFKVRHLRTVKIATEI
jgi:hypothetical protein